jgi:hypothetical protein
MTDGQLDGRTQRCEELSGVFHFSRSFVSFDLLVEAHRRSRRVAFSLSAAR